MKKIIAVVLVFVMCLSFVACNKATKTEECERCEKYENLIGLLENEEYEEAINEISKLAENTTAESQESTEIINITMDNWQKYFEVKHWVSTVSKNDFDEIIGFFPAYALILKDEWQNKIVDSDIQIEYSCTGGYEKWFSYNIKTQELVEGELYSTDTKDLIKETQSWDYSSTNKPGIKFVSTTLPDTFSIDGDIAKIVACGYSNTEIHRIQGSLTVTK